MREILTTQPNRENTSASILDRWKGKEIKVVGQENRIETDWEVFAAEIIDKKPVIYIRKKVPAGDPNTITRGIDYEKFLSWQNQH